MPGRPPAFGSLLVAAVIAAGWVVAGCGGPTTCLVEGTAAVADQPVEMGTVSLEWLAGGRPPATAAIVKGRFELTERARLEPGRYRVRLTAPDLAKFDPAVAPTPERPNTFVSLVGDRWNTASDLAVDLRVGVNRLDLSGPAQGPAAVR